MEDFIDGTHKMLIDRGLDVRSANEVCLLLKYKRPIIQATFYYRLKGMTQEQIAEKVGVVRSAISKYINAGCADIKDRLSRNRDKTDF